MGKKLIIKGADFSTNGIKDQLSMLMGGITANPSSADYGKAPSVLLTTRARTYGTVCKLPSGGTMRLTNLSGWAIGLVGYSYPWSGETHSVADAILSVTTDDGKPTTDYITDGVFSYTNNSENDYYIAVFLAKADVSQVFTIEDIPDIYLSVE